MMLRFIFYIEDNKETHSQPYTKIQTFPGAQEGNTIHLKPSGCKPLKMIIGGKCYYFVFCIYFPITKWKKVMKQNNVNLCWSLSQKVYIHLTFTCIVLTSWASREVGSQHHTVTREQSNMQIKMCLEGDVQRCFMHWVLYNVNIL